MRTKKITKCDVKNCLFKDCEKPLAFYGEERHEGLTAKCVLNNGKVKFFRIVSSSYLKEMQHNPEMTNNLDIISYFANDNEMLYDILHTLTREIIEEM